MKTVTRRQLAGLALGSVAAAAAVPASAKPSAQTPSQTSSDWFPQAVESKRRAAAELAAVDVPTAFEPAFEFKP